MKKNKTISTIESHNKQYSGSTGRHFTLKRYFLPPLAIVFACLVVMFVYQVFSRMQSDITDKIDRTRNTAHLLYINHIMKDVDELGAVMYTISRVRGLHRGLALKDRNTLLQKAASLFVNLRKYYSIMHFYFSDDNRVNILRVHQPGRFGDTINRTTTVKAEQTGELTYGIELGPLGTFTLRLVKPWFNKNKTRCIGYVELGKEVHHAIELVKQFVDAKIFIVIYKKYLSKEPWEEGMQMLGLEAAWEQFPAFVISRQISDELPEEFLDKLAVKGIPNSDSNFFIRHNNHAYHTVFIPLQDAGNQIVGQMAVLIDTTKEYDYGYKLIFWGGIIAFVVGGTVFAAFYWLVDRVEFLLDEHQRSLLHLATHDGLTGLYNHRAFHHILEEEIERAQRFGREFSLLMMDLDHFKKVNDTYGHQAGDKVLSTIAHRILLELRSIDKIARYGGEEFAVILTEASSSVAHEIAERIRSTIENFEFGTNGKQKFCGTISIGLAVFPQDADSKKGLISAADQALYHAKVSGRNCVCLYHQIHSQKNDKEFASE